MKNNNSKLAFDQTWGWKPVLGAAKTNITPVSHNSLTLTEDGDLILIRFHEGPPFIQLIVPWDAMELCPPSSLVTPVQAVFSAVMVSQRMLNGARGSGDTLFASR